MAQLGALCISNLCATKPVEYKKMLEELRDSPEKDHDRIYKKYAVLSEKNNLDTKKLLKEKGKDSPEVQANLQEMNQALQFSKDQILTAPYREHLNQGSNESEDMHLDISKMNEHDYQNLKEVRFLEYENLNSLKDYTNKESKAQIKDYLGSKDYEGTNQTFWSKPVIRMYGLPALQTIGGTASIVGSALVSETGIGLPLGIYLAGTGADDVQTGVSNFGREPANQRVSTREQALQNIGLSEKMLLTPRWL